MLSTCDKCWMIHLDRNGKFDSFLVDTAFLSDGSDTDDKFLELYKICKI